MLVDGKLELGSPKLYTHDAMHSFYQFWYPMETLPLPGMCHTILHRFCIDCDIDVDSINNILCLMGQLGCELLHTNSPECFPRMELSAKDVPARKGCLEPAVIVIRRMRYDRQTKVS